MRRTVSLVIILSSLLAAPSALAFRLGPDAGMPVLGNPADALASVPLDDELYEPATRCLRIARPGMERLALWLEARPRGASWGSFRCERWGKGSASLHAEGRALDWHLDVTDAADRREARRLIALLLAPDALGQPRALARRMGVQELIWDCAYWGAGMEDFVAYRACARDGVDPTTAHRDHVHIGLTRDGAMGRTSFWRGGK